MKTLELRLDPEAVRPLLTHLHKMIDDLAGDLATSAVPPDEDELMSGIWNDELMQSQSSDLSAMIDLFSEEFADTGRTRVSEENADFILRGCSAIRLRIREITLVSVTNEMLESGEIDFEGMSVEERIGYGAYTLLASLQELIVAQLYGEEPDS